MAWLEAKIAFRSFRSLHRGSFVSLTTFLTLLGVSLGVMSLVIVLSVMNGFETELRTQLVNAEAHLLLYRKVEGISMWKELTQKIKESDKMIQSVVPLLHREVLFIHEGRVQGGILQGLRPQDFGQTSYLKDKKLAKDECLVGKELFQRLGLKKGGKLKILFPQSSAEGDPMLVQCRARDTFEPGLYEYSSRYVVGDLATLQAQTGWKDRVSAFKVYLSNPDQAAAVGRRIREVISFPFFIRTWKHLNQNIFLAIKIEKVIMAIILSSIILVALFNVMSSLVMIVIEKTKEIAILRAIGMQARSIKKIFLWQGFLLGVLGTVF